MKGRILRAPRGGLGVWGAPLLSLVILLAFLGLWHVGTLQETGKQVVDRGICEARRGRRGDRTEIRVARPRPTWDASSGNT